MTVSFRVRRAVFGPLLLMLWLTATLAQATGTGTGSDRLLVLSYHDVRDDVAERGDPDPYAIDTQNFAAHLDWLAGNGYHVVSLDQVVAAAEGHQPLPERAVLLTFDDGLRSLYTHVFPLLKAYDYPAVAAVVTSWLELPEGGSIDYGHRRFGTQDLVTWEQLREMQASGLVEVASHSHDLHRGVIGNPQGNEMPAAVTRRYLVDHGRHETDAEYRQRIAADLALSASRISQELGRAPRALVWPYAAYSRSANLLAEQQGMSITFGLSGRDTHLADGMQAMARLLVMNNATAEDLVYELRHNRSRQFRRAIQVDLDHVYDDDPAQIERNLDALVERIRRIGPNQVWLQAFADPDGNGSADALYFPNRHLPVRADLFNRVAWQLFTRANVEVLAWMPVLGFELPDVEQRHSLAIASNEQDGIFRLDFTRPEVRRIITEIYQDLAANAHIAGLLFHDDAYLRDTELPELYPHQPAARTRALIEFTLALTEAAEQWRPNLVTVRNLYARPVLEPESQQWFAQRLDLFRNAYDHTALMAMPWMEGSRRPKAWLRRLVNAVREHDPHFEHTVFQLQTLDWRSARPISPRRLTATVRQLVAAGVRHLAWYPDDFIADQPPLDVARASMSARSFPYEER